jgi:hypothetical protein
MARRQQKRGGDYPKLLDECLTACINVSRFLQSKEPIGRLTHCRSDDLARFLLQGSHLGSTSAWSGGEHEPNGQSSCPSGVHCVALFRSWARWRRAFHLSEITLGRGAAIRDNDIVSFRCGPHGHRGKSTLAKLRIACVTTRRFAPPWSLSPQCRPVTAAFDRAQI